MTSSWRHISAKHSGYVPLINVYIRSKYEVHWSIFKQTINIFMFSHFVWDFLYIIGIFRGMTKNRHLVNEITGELEFPYASLTPRWKRLMFLYTNTYNLGQFIAYILLKWAFFTAIWGRNRQTDVIWRHMTSQYPILTKIWWDIFNSLIQYSWSFLRISMQLSSFIIIFPSPYDFGRQLKSWRQPPVTKHL